jgi:hypothetical protein
VKSFHQKLEDTFRAREVRVVGEDGVSYTGWVKTLDRKYRHFLLYDAEREDGKSIDAVLIPEAERVELLDHEITVARIPISEIAESPYASRSFAKEENQEYIKDVQDHRGCRYFPLIREITDGYEVIDGNKALWVCSKAGVETQPCRIVRRSDWEAAQQFVYDHFPVSEHISEDGEPEPGYYDEESIEKSIHLLYERWGDRIQNLHPVAYNLDRLNISL